MRLPPFFCHVDDFWKLIESHWHREQLKNISQIERTRHRSLPNFMVNLVSVLIAYCHQRKKPSLRIHKPILDSVSYP